MEPDQVVGCSGIQQILLSLLQSFEAATQRAGREVLFDGIGSSWYVSPHWTILSSLPTIMIPLHRPLFHNLPTRGFQKPQRKQALMDHDPNR